jgi:hypothetical protein
VWYKLATTLRALHQWNEALELFDLVLASPDLDYLSKYKDIPVMALMALGRGDCLMHLRDGQKDLVKFDKQVG